MPKPQRNGKFPGDTEESPPGTEWWWDGYDWHLSDYEDGFAPEGESL